MTRPDRLLLLLLLPFLPWSCNEDKMISLAPNVFLSWDGLTWAILDSRHDPAAAKLAPGGIVRVADVANLAVSSKSIIGRSRDGRFFIMSLEVPTDEVTWYNSEQDWRRECEPRGADTTALKAPTDF